MTDSTTGDLERRVVLAIREATGSGWPPDKPSTENELNYVRAALKAHAGWLESEGLVVVPKEPTAEMLESAYRAQHWEPGLGPNISRAQDKRKFQAMLAAAQQEDQHHD